MLLYFDSATLIRNYIGNKNSHAPSSNKNRLATETEENMTNGETVDCPRF